MPIYLIEVTEEDIAKGQRLQVGWCPIALAIKRATGFGDVAVGAEEAALGDFTDVCLPDIAKSFINRFDASKKGQTSDLSLEPFSFTIDTEITGDGYDHADDEAGDYEEEEG